MKRTKQFQENLRTLPVVVVPPPRKRRPMWMPPRKHVLTFQGSSFWRYRLSRPHKTDEAKLVHDHAHNLQSFRRSGIHSEKCHCPCCVGTCDIESCRSECWVSVPGSATCLEIDPDVELVQAFHTTVTAFGAAMERCLVQRAHEQEEHERQQRWGDKDPEDAPHDVDCWWCPWCPRSNTEAIKEDHASKFDQEHTEDNDRLSAVSLSEDLYDQACWCCFREK